ncbi:stationary phase inducible protein CsiE [Salmonella enterica subsp. enterica serovar Sanjuan]|uniref:Stationary phase inducible protein CsiE n=1 Tax=Salmonella enterica subsp. enterica serovar Sanjuan TaxID=1160765 RepID=A0A3S4EQL5_SALET|nr:stationary phase inducible protein CsiE [Salmonella enterica subsp. enterica serovar Sanjuan]
MTILICTRSLICAPAGYKNHLNIATCSPASLLQYCLLQHHAGITPEFNPVQQIWAQSCAEYPLAQEIGRHWQRHVMQAAPLNEALFMALLFSMIRLPDPIRDTHQRAQQLRLEVARLVLRFREKGNVRFSDEQGLNDQLYVHLAQALNRSLFTIGIDNTLPEEFNRLIRVWFAPHVRRSPGLKPNMVSTFPRKRRGWWQ